MFETAQAVQTLTVLLMFAVLIQFCVDRIKDIVGDTIMMFIKAPVWALGFGILFAFLFQLDVFSMLGLLPILPAVAKLVTGLIISAGSAPIHELVEKIRQARINDTQLLTIGSAMLEDQNTTLDQRKESNVYAKTDSSDQ